MGGYLMGLVTLWAVFAVAATVVATLVETAGFIHVGAAAFLGVGAYTAALLSTRFGLDPQLALLMTVPMGMAVGGIFHIVVGNRSGDVLALTSLAVGVVMHGIMLNATSITDGPMGVAGIPPLPPLTWHPAADAILFLAVVLGLGFFVRRSRFGLRIRALRNDEELAEDLELQPRRIRVLLWTASSTILSLAGGLFAFQLRYIDPSSFAVRESVSILAMSLMLPSQRVFNAGLGTLVFIALPELLRFLGLPAETGAQVRQLLFGCVLVLVAGRARWGRLGITTAGGGDRA